MVSWTKWQGSEAQTEGSSSGVPAARYFWGTEGAYAVSQRAHPQAPFLSGGNHLWMKSWQKAVFQASGCSLSPQPHPSWYPRGWLGTQGLA